MRFLAGLIAFPLLAHAAGEGTWQASSVGITLTERGVVASSQPLVPSQPVNGLMTMVAWRYEFNSPNPSGLTVRLCSQTRCVAIDGPGGTTLGLKDVPAIEPLRFVWEIPGSGRLMQPLQVSSNQVIVNYRQPASNG